MSPSPYYELICKNECRNTHHKLVMNSLMRLECDDAEKWRDLFVKYFEFYLKGSKAPDTDFKDFRNHVLHVADNFWGGPVKQAEKWYETTVAHLKNENWSSAVYAAGVTSHYFMDPLMPLHTGQTEEEGVIHRACEWSVNKSFVSLIERLENGPGYPTIKLATGNDWMKTAIHGGAVMANKHYKDFIDHYDLKLGKKNPPDGLNDHLQDVTSRLLGHASVGFARILERAFEESGAEPVSKSSPLTKLLYQVTSPISWFRKGWFGWSAKSTIKKIESEFNAKGKVVASLPQDEKIVRTQHAIEILKLDVDELDERPIGAVGSKSDSGPLISRALEVEETPNQADTEPQAAARSQPPAAAKPQAGLRPPGKMTQPIRSLQPKKAAPAKKAKPAPVRQSGRMVIPASAKFRLGWDQPLEDAPSIGDKTAARFSSVGIDTVADFLMCDPQATAYALNIRHITPDKVAQWQTQAKLACQIPGIHGHDAQIMVGCGFVTPEEIAEAEPELILELVDAFSNTPDAEFILRSNKAPDLEEVNNWIQWSKQSRDLHAA